MEFRDLTRKEIDVRVGQVGNGWATLLLYKDARVDMDILDETVGSENWQRRHYEVKGNMYCSVGIKCGGEWIWKDDCGTESNTEKEKGESSDSFKRACVNWGIGRELYTSPKIFVDCETADKKIKDLKDFKVSEISIEDKVITALKITAYNKARRAEEIIFNWKLKAASDTLQKPKSIQETKPQETVEPIKMTLEEAKKLRTKSGIELDKLTNKQLDAFLNCNRETHKKAAELILKEREAKRTQMLEEMAEEEVPWEE